MKQVLRILAMLCVALMLAGACGQSGAPESTSEKVGEAQQEVLGAPCHGDATCTGSPPQRCCHVGSSNICVGQCDDAHCGQCALDCTATGKYCYGAPGNGFCDSTSVCVICKSNGECTGGKICTGTLPNTQCTCPSGQTDCSGTCKDLQTDESNCGMCGNVCASGYGCLAGTCTACPGGTCTSCTDDHGCPFKTKCESGLCFGHCIDHTGCSDDQLCINSVCTSEPSSGADQTAKDTYCRNTYDGGAAIGTSWRMMSCNVGGTDYCVQTAASTKYNQGFCTYSGLCNNAPVNPSWDVAHYWIPNGQTIVGSCAGWESSSCMTTPTSGIPRTDCYWKMCPAPAEGSTCDDKW